MGVPVAERITIHNLLPDWLVAVLVTDNISPQTKFPIRTASLSETMELYDALPSKLRQLYDSLPEPEDLILYTRIVKTVGAERAYDLIASEIEKLYPGWKRPPTQPKEPQT